MADNEQQVLEGGNNQLPQQIQRIHLDASLEGGNLLAQINQEYPPISASGADRIQGVESALLTGNPAVPVAASSDLPIVGGIAVTTFGFPSPFQAPTNPERPLAMFAGMDSRTTTPAAPLLAPPPGTTPVQPSSVPASNQFLSQMSALDLAQVVAGAIHGFKTESWIAEDVSGAALLEHVAPSVLSEFLEHELNITSKFIRNRIQFLLMQLIEKDTSMDAQHRGKWANFKPYLAQSGQQQPPPIPSGATQVDNTSRTLFSTPLSGGLSRTQAVPSTPAFFSGRQKTNEQSLNHAPPPFLRECGSPEDFSMDDTSLFAQTTRASVGGSASNIGQAFGGSGIQITINQPSATPPKYVVLNCASDSTEFYNWIRKNTKESLLALPVDRRNLSQLVSEDVKEEVARIIRTLGPTNTFYFNTENCPYPRSWPEVNDHLLKKILFGINGPRSAAEAKLKLKMRLCFLNDSTQTQDKVGPKVRKFCNEFKATLKDFTYTYHLWEESDKLSHEMIIEAFSDCFSNTEQIKGPDGTMVPKSRNYAKIKEMIRERKGQSLEEIIHYIIDSFERIDIAVRSSKALSYEIKPWKTDEGGKGKKRAFNQISGGPSAPSGKKPPRPPADHPRCNNCGRKSHPCGERTCYLFGHPQGRGASGSWTDGEPSLFITADAMKEWKKTRDPVFYGYPENKRLKGG